jgi:hypothetical protein
MPIPTLFIVGHCLEAYCKAAVLKNNPSVNIFRYGHEIETMINDIKRDIGILSGIMFYPNVESRFMTGGLISSFCSQSRTLLGCKISKRYKVSWNYWKENAYTVFSSRYGKKSILVANNA